MLKPTQSFTLADPRTFDGDPYEVAERAVRQAAAVAHLLVDAIESAYVMARNAQLERELHASGECDATAYLPSAEGMRWTQTLKTAQAAEKNLAILAMAAGFNPKAPLGAE